MTDFFANQGLFINGIHHLSPKEALAAIARGAILVDIREEYETGMKAFDVPGVVYLANSSLRDEFEQLTADRPLILADSVGLRSKLAVAFLKERGFVDVANLNGGIVDWDAAGMPTRTNPDEQWVGSCACKLKPRKNFRGTNT
jgi:rhodanese-related sulfurtransferase